LKQIIAPIHSNEEIMPGIHLLWAEAPQIVSEAQPGQFVMVRSGEDHDPLLRRPLSIHRVGESGALGLLFEVVGQGTRWLAQRKAGESVDLLGPLGRGFEIHSQKLLLVAGGVGIAPLIFLAEKAAADGRHVTLLSGSKTAATVYPNHLLPPYIKPITVTEDGSLGQRGLVTDLLVGTAAFHREAEQIIACGPISMYQAISQLPGMEGRSVQVSMEARMGCGFGGCTGCAIETRRGLKLVCRDGPVFELSDLIW
jgi:dihydroorotate dehydrogenase electron transfer subunit